MPKSALVIILTIFSLLISGCLSGSENENQNPEDKEYDFSLPSSSVLTRQEAKEVVNEAGEKYNRIAAGNNESLELDNVKYQYLPAEFSSKEDLRERLGQSFTPDYKDYLINQLGIFEKGERLARPDVEAETLLNFQNPYLQKKERGNASTPAKEEAEEKEEIGDEIILYRVKEYLPGDEEKKETPVLVQFTQNKDEEWLIEEIIHEAETPQIVPQEPANVEQPDADQPINDFEVPSPEVDSIPDPDSSSEADAFGEPHNGNPDNENQDSYQELERPQEIQPPTDFQESSDLERPEGLESPKTEMQRPEPLR